jgi:hypothetical protein
MTYDLIIRGGRVLDPSQNFEAVTDLGIVGQRIAGMIAIGMMRDDTSGDERRGDLQYARNASREHIGSSPGHRAERWGRYAVRRLTWRLTS